MDFSGSAHLGTLASHAGRIPVHKSPEVLRIDKSGASNHSGSDPRQLSQNAENSASARLIANQPELHKNAEMHKNPDKAAGPPPSFEVSLLEVEQDLKQVIARMEASRGQVRDADAVTAESPAQHLQIQDPPQQSAPAASMNSARTLVGDTNPLAR